MYTAHTYYISITILCPLTALYQINIPHSWLIKLYYNSLLMPQILFSLIDHPPYSGSIWPNLYKSMLYLLPKNCNRYFITIAVWFLQNVFLILLLLIFPSFTETKSLKSQEKPCVKCVVVGDCAVGKTNLILSYLENRFNTEHVPTASDIYNGKWKKGRFYP